MTAKEQTLAKIAATLGFQTLETRNSDSLDFHEVAVWSLKAALEAAYEAGKKSTQESIQDEPIDQALVDYTVEKFHNKMNGCPRGVAWEWVKGLNMRDALTNAAWDAIRNHPDTRFQISNK